MNKEIMKNFNGMNDPDYKEWVKGVELMELDHKFKLLLVKKEIGTCRMMISKYKGDIAALNNQLKEIKEKLLKLKGGKK